MYYENVYQDKIIISFLCSSFCMNEMPPQVLAGTDMLGGRCRWELIPTLMYSICLLASKEHVLGLVLLWFYYSLGRQIASR